MKQILLIDDLEVPIGYELLEVIADRLPDSINNQPLFHKLAQHDIADIRYAISYFDNLSIETVKLLIQDSEIRVVERILQNSNHISRLSEHEIREIIDKYPTTEILKNIVRNYDEIDAEEPEEIIEYILQIAEKNLPVIGEIASFYNTPKKILRKLTKHHDPDIALKAKETLS